MIREFPLRQEELEDKRRRLERLRDRVAHDHEVIVRLERELGDFVCAACGKAHADRCLESLG